jgi:hypothetical protein
MKWEYKVVNIKGVDMGSIQNKLNDLGKEGWELVCAVVESAVFYDNYVIMKRPLVGV